MIALINALAKKTIVKNIALVKFTARGKKKVVIPIPTMMTPVVMTIIPEKAEEAEEEALVMQITILTLVITATDLSGITVLIPTTVSVLFLVLQSPMFREKAIIDSLPTAVQVEKFMSAATSIEKCTFEDIFKGNDTSLRDQREDTKITDKAALLMTSHIVIQGEELMLVTFTKKDTFSVIQDIIERNFPEIEAIVPIEITINAS